MNQASSDDVRLMIESTSPYIKADDLLDQDVTVTIVGVHTGTVEDPKSKKKSRKAIVDLKGWDKPFCCNITNARTIATDLGYGWKGKAWVGKRITLYSKQGVRRPDGTVGPAIRVRGTVPTSPGVPQLAPKTTEPTNQSVGREPGEDG